MRVGALLDRGEVGAGAAKVSCACEGLCAGGPVGGAVSYPVAVAGERARGLSVVEAAQDRSCLVVSRGGQRAGVRAAVEGRGDDGERPGVGGDELRGWTRAVPLAWTTAGIWSRARPVTGTATDMNGLPWARSK